MTRSASDSLGKVLLMEGSSQVVPQNRRLSESVFNTVCNGATARMLRSCCDAIVTQEMTELFFIIEPLLLCMQT